MAALDPIPPPVGPRLGRFASSMLDHLIFRLGLEMPPSNQILCREGHIRSVQTHLKVVEKRASLLYICGPPGTGKSTVIKHVASKLNSEMLHYNGMNFSSVKQFLKKLLFDLL